MQMFEARSASELRGYVLSELGMTPSPHAGYTVFSNTRDDFLRLYGQEGLYEFGVADYTVDHSFAARFDCHEGILRFGTMYEGRTFVKMDGSEEASFLPSVFITLETDASGMQKWEPEQRLCGAEFSLYPAFYEPACACLEGAPRLQDVLEPNRTHRFMPLELVSLIERLIDADRAGTLNPLAVQAGALEAVGVVVEAARRQANPFATEQAPKRFPLPSNRKAVFTPSELQRIERARDILDRSYSAPPTIDALARAVGMGPQKLAAGFQRIYHTTPGRYTAKLRMTEAALLLRTTDASVEVVSARVGYSHPSNFIKAFRRSFSCTPGRYREQETKDRSAAGGPLDRRVAP